MAKAEKRRESQRTAEDCRAKEPRSGALPSKGLAQPGGETLLRDAKEEDRRDAQRNAEGQRRSAENCKGIALRGYAATVNVD